MLQPIQAEDTTPPIPNAPGAEFRQLNQRLFEAAKMGYEEEVLTYLNAGASVKGRDRFGNTALLLAARTNKKKSVTSFTPSV